MMMMMMMNGVLVYDSALVRLYWAGATWANEINLLWIMPQGQDKFPILLSTHCCWVDIGGVDAKLQESNPSPLDLGTDALTTRPRYPHVVRGIKRFHGEVTDESWYETSQCHNIHLICPVCPRPGIALQCRMVALNTIHFSQWLFGKFLVSRIIEQAYI